MNKRNIPNLFLIGAPKSGTSALATQLGQHPEIFLNKKEPRYFDACTFFDFEEDWPIKSVEEYLSLFDGEVALNSQYRLDASVFNMYSSASIENILNLSPDAKFILVMRDPLSASKSMHIQRLKYIDLKMRELSEDFESCWNMLDQRREGAGFPPGCRNKFLFRYDLLYSYNKYLPFIRDLINQNNILYINYDDFKKDPHLIYSKIFEFLNVTPVETKTNVVNPSNVVIINRKNLVIHGVRSVLSQCSRGLGLSGSAVSRKVSSYLRFDVAKPRGKATDIDQAVRKYFGESYEAMEEVLKENSF